MVQSYDGLELIFKDNNLTFIESTHFSKNRDLHTWCLTNKPQPCMRESISSIVHVIPWQPCIMCHDHLACNFLRCCRNSKDCLYIIIVVVWSKQERHHVGHPSSKDSINSTDFVTQSFCLGEGLVPNQTPHHYCLHGDLSARGVKLRLYGLGLFILYMPNR